MANDPQRPPKALQREDAGSPSAAMDRKSVLARAKERSRARVGGGERPGDMEGTPRFDQLQSDPRMQAAPGATSPPSALSKGTAVALEAVAQANRDRPAPPEAPEAPEEPGTLEPEDLVEVLQCDARTARRVWEVLYPENDPSGLGKQRKAIEKRVGPLDIGEFLMNGVVSQRVPIIPSAGDQKGLEVVFTTVTDGVEAHIDRLVADEAARIRHVRLEGGSDKVIDANMTEREFVRRQNEYAVVAHVRSYMGQAWPPITNAQGLVDEAAVRTRLEKVRQLPSPVFVLIINNLGWFLDRVQETLDVAVLGNG